MIELKIKGENVAVRDNTIAYTHRVNERSKGSITVKTPLGVKYQKYSKLELEEKGEEVAIQGGYNPPYNTKARVSYIKGKTSVNKLPNSDELKIGSSIVQYNFETSLLIPYINDKITISFDAIANDDNIHVIDAYLRDNTLANIISGSQMQKITINEEWQRISYIFTLSDINSITDIGFAIRGNTSVDINNLGTYSIKNVVIEKGEVNNTVYFEGLKSVGGTIEGQTLPTLRGLETVYDELISGKITRRCGEIIFDGTREWTYNSTFVDDDYYRFYTTIPADMLKNTSTIKFSDDLYHIVFGVYLNLDVPKIYVNSTDVNDLKAYLVSAPLTVIYQITTETTESTPSILFDMTYGQPLVIDSIETEFKAILDYKHHFSGVIDTIETYDEGKSRYHEIDCIDNHYFVEKRTVTKAFIEEFAGVIAKYIVDNVLYQEGIWYDEESIHQGNKLTLSFNLVYCDDAYDKLELKTGFAWWIDNDKKLYFQDPTATVNPTIITDEIIKHRTFKNNITNFQYRNTQYIKGPKGYTETKIEEVTYQESNPNSIVLAFKVGNIDKIEIGRNEVYTEISTDKIARKGENPDAAFLYSKDDSIIAYNRWGLDESLRLVDGDKVRTSYQGLIPLLVISKDLGQIEYVKALEGGSGIVENVDIDQENEGYIASLEIANGNIKKYGDADTLDFGFQTYVKTFEPGELVHANILSEGINDDVLIEEVSGVDEGDRFLYSIKCVKGAIHPSWQRYFQTMLEDRATDVDDTSNITDTLVVSKEYVKSWTVEVPNPFNIWYPSEVLFPSENLYPSFDDDNRFTRVEVDYLENLVLKTKSFSRSIYYPSDTEIITIFYIPPAVCNGLIQTFRFYGGNDGTQLLTTVDESANNFNKNQYESIQILRTDTKGS